MLIWQTVYIVGAHVANMIIKKNLIVTKKKQCQQILKQIKKPPQKIKSLKWWM